MTFKVFFECSRFFPRAERDGRFNSPRAVLGCIRVVSLVVRLQPSLQIISQASVSVGCVFMIQKDINIGETLHFSPLARQGGIRKDAHEGNVFGPVSPQLRRGSLQPQLRFEWRLVGARGFEPPTPCSQSRCASRLRHAPAVL
jgi:hypothetical protein